MSNTTRSSQCHPSSHRNDARARKNLGKLIAPLLLTTLVFAGCARNYVITLNDGTMITAASKPKLKDSRYIYRNLDGGKSYVPAVAVHEIAPASMHKDPDQTFGSKR